MLSLVLVLQGGYQLPFVRAVCNSNWLWALYLLLPTANSCQLLPRVLLVSGLSSVNPALSEYLSVRLRRSLFFVFHCHESPNLLPSTFTLSFCLRMSLFFVLHYHESPNVLPSTFTLLGESRQCLLPMYCQSTFLPV